VSVVSEGDQFLYGLGKVASLLKDLLLPAALASLGFYLQKRDKDQKEKQDREKEQQEAKEHEQEKLRTELREKEKKQQEAKEREQEELRTELREIWKLMLPKSHTNAEQHYMPVVSSIELLVSEVRAVRPNSTDEQWQQLLWALLRFLRRMQHLAQEIGG